MSTNAAAQPVATPYPLWRPTLVWLAVVALLLALIGQGFHAWMQQRLHGDIVTGMRTVGQGGVAWGLYITFDMYFIGLAFAGVCISAVTRLFRITDLRPLTRAAELLTLVALPMAAMTVMADLGRPLKGLLALPAYARPQSPFFGTFTMVVSGCLFASGVYFLLSGRLDAARLKAVAPRLLRPLFALWASGWKDTAEERRRHRLVGFWVAVIVVPWLVLATSTIGFVFGIQGGRPGWYSALQAPSFVVLAAASGVGALIFIAAVVRLTQDLQSVITERAFRLLGHAMLILINVYLYFMLVEELTALYASGKAEKYTNREILFGSFGHLFWIAAGCLVAALLICFVLFARRRVSIGWLVTAALLVNAAAVLRRYLLVVPSQTEGLLLNYERGAYVPSMIELRVIVAILALMVLAYTVFVRLFPIVPLDPEREDIGIKDEPAIQDPRRKFLRRLTFIVTMSVGIALLTTGLAYCLRVGTLPYLDPVVPYSPVIFIVGVLLVFASALLYEIFPPVKAPEPERAPEA